ncbi:MAG: hypothetical protein ACP5NE_01220 [Candidatus Micrarchaeia archaeon]
MDFYDILQAGCGDARAYGPILGFKAFFIAGEDFSISYSDSKSVNDNSNAVAGENLKKLARFARYKRFIIPLSFEIDKFLISRVKDSEAVLCLPISSITSSYGFVRARRIRMLQKLYTYAYRSGASVAIASFSPSKQYMNSREQLLALAKLIAGNEERARSAISCNALLKGQKM